MNKGFECNAYRICHRLGTGRVGCTALTSPFPLSKDETPVEYQLKDIRQQLILIQACLSSIVLLLNSQMND